MSKRLKLNIEDNTISTTESTSSTALSTTLSSASSTTLCSSSNISTLDKTFVLNDSVFVRKFDSYGRLIFAYNSKDLVDNTVSSGILHVYTSGLDTTDISFFVPNITFTGSFLLDNEKILPDGPIKLFHSNAFGQYLMYVGMMKKNEFIKGTMFLENGAKKYQGTFENSLFKEGTLFHTNGSVKWKGSFEQGVPHGPGDFYTYTNRYIKGIMKNGILSEGTQYKDSLIEYEGSFHNTDFHGRGILYPNGLTSVPYERYIGEFMYDLPLFCLWEVMSITHEVPVNAQIDHKYIFKYAGGFCKDSKGFRFSGMGALFFRQPDENGVTQLVKWVGKFHYGKRIGVFRIFLTEESDPLLKISSIKSGDWSSISEHYKFTDLEYGTLLGTTCFVNGLQMGSIQIYKLGKLLYEGSGTASATEIVETIFVRDGQGTEYNICNEQPIWKGWWLNGEMKIVEVLYDDEGHKLFEVDDNYTFTIMADDIYEDLFITFLDSARRWPELNGPGNIYESDGSTVLYHTNFKDGIIEDIPNLDSNDFEVKENKLTDYVTLDSLRRGYNVIAFNGGEQFMQFVSMSTFTKLITDVPLKDPLRGSYPGYRFKKFKLV
jgi:hypothetical protein